MYSKAVQTLCSMAKYKAVKMKVTGAHLCEPGSQQDVYSVGYTAAYTTDFSINRLRPSYRVFPYVWPDMILPIGLWLRGWFSSRSRGRLNYH